MLEQQTEKKTLRLILCTFERTLIQKQHMTILYLQLLFKFTKLLICYAFSVCIAESVHQIFTINFHALVICVSMTNNVQFSKNLKNTEQGQNHSEIQQQIWQSLQTRKANQVSPKVR